MLWQELRGPAEALAQEGKSPSKSPGKQESKQAQTHNPTTKKFPLMHLTDKLIIALYFLANILIGLYFASKKTKDATELIDSTNTMPGWVLGLSIVVTYFSSISFLAFTGKAYSSDWSALVYNGTFILLLFLTIHYFIPFHRGSGDISAFTHLGRRFGPWAVIYSVCCHTIVNVMRMGVMLFLISKALAHVTGWSDINIIITIGTITTLYTCFGGLKSVIWTDALQFLVMLIGVTFVFSFLISNIPGGFSGFYNVAIEHNKFSLGNLSPDLTTDSFWTIMLTGFALNLYNFAISPPFTQRYTAARTAKEANKAMIWSSVLCTGLVVFFFLIGTALFVYHQTNPGSLPESISPKDGDGAYSYFIANTLPVGLKGVIIASILAAAMSSIDSVVNSLSMLYLINIHKPYINPNPSQKTSLTLIYVTALGSGALAIIAAILLRQEESILYTWYAISSVITGGTLGLFLFGLISKKARRPAAIFGVVTGSLVFIWATLSPKLIGPWALFANPFHSFMTFTLANLAIIIGGLLWHVLTKEKSDTLTQKEAHSAS